MGNITSDSGIPAAAFGPLYAPRDASPNLFDPLSWLATPGAPAPPGSLLERRVGFPIATVLRDTTPPIGFAVINDSLSGGGIRIHALSAASDAAGAIPIAGGTVFVTDDLDLAVRTAGVLGGSAQPSAYEIIGRGADRAITLYLAALPDGTFPHVGSVVIGATAPRSKQYVVEAMRPGDRFRPLVSMIASESTRDFFLFPLPNAPPLAAIRVRYAGDYYTPTAVSAVTAGAYDLVSGVTAVQLSHYPDFRDARDIASGTPGELAGGWMPFDEGTSLYAWGTVNAGRLWGARGGTLPGAILSLVPVGQSGDYVATDGANLFSTEGGVLVLRKAFPPGEFATCLAAHQGRVYAATSSGNVYVTDSGKSYSLGFALPTGVGAPSPPGARCMTSYNGRLYVGTDPSPAPDSLGHGLVYSWDGAVLRLPFFVGDQGAFVAASSMSPAGGRLFVGTAVYSPASPSAKVYAYDGVGVSAVSAPAVNAVQALGLAAGGSLWAALSDGRIQALAISGNTLGMWSDVYSGSAANYYQIDGSSTPGFTWVPSDAGLIAYFTDAAGVSKFAVVGEPPSYPKGLSSVWYNTPVDFTHVPSAGVNPNFSGTDGPISWADLNTLRPPVVVVDGNVAVFFGYIRAFDSGAHTFFVNVGGGARLYLGGTLLLDKWFQSPGVEYLCRASLVAGEWVPFRLEYSSARGAGIARGITVSWTTPAGNTKAPIPRDAFATSTAAPPGSPLHSITSVSGVVVAGAGDGRVYSLDAAALRGRKRFVYARFRDAAGNATPLPGIAGGADGIPNITYVDPLDPSKAVAEGVYDSVMEGASGPGGALAPSHIWQVTTAAKVSGGATIPPATVVAGYDAGAGSPPLYGPNRWARQRGIFESDPFYVATLSSWQSLDVLSTIPPPASPSPDLGSESGAEVLTYVRAGSTRDRCLSEGWGTPVSRSTIATPSATGTLHTASNLQTVVGNWLQFKIEIVTATRDLTPVVATATLSYNEANASYFFTKIFDASVGAGAPPYPLWRRGLLTENSLPNGGTIAYGYTTSDDPSVTYEFSRYTPIPPNKVFELPAPSSKIRFGILLVSLDGGYQAVVNDFAVQLDAGDANLYPSRP